MALVACKDCTAQISTEAKTCPKCGSQNAAAYKGVRIAGLIYLGVIALLFWGIWNVLTPSPKGSQVTGADLGAAWPLKVSAVELLCEGSPPAALAKVDGKLYALNGSARTAAKDKGWLDGVTLAKPNPEMPEIPMDFTPLVERAQALCRH
ncbi:DUF2511 domain-containing protein [Stenotrophomonas rhizophila]|nr:DUF2511 domain-containing protein [Stenotrophomonas rhizophila]